MKISRCGNCDAKFLVGRVFCPSCKSDAIEMIDLLEGKVIEIVSLVATPEPFPDNYSIAMIDANGIVLFARTDESLKKGDSVGITEDEFGPICNKI